MTKWADYLISAVSYNSEHLISAAIRHKDSGKGITNGIPIDRLTVASDIKNGLTYLTIYSGRNSWKKGQQIHTFTIEGNPYIRIDENKVKLDYLGDLPETSIMLSEDEEATPEQLSRLEKLEKQIQELESQSEPPSSPRGSLPKESTEELPQELDLVPEQVTQSEPPSSPRGSLPKESTTFSEESIPESEDEEATPEQLAQLAELQQQIDELEDMLSSQILPEILPEDEEATPEQLAQLAELQQQIDELEDMMSTELPTPKQQIVKKPSKKSKTQNTLENTDTEHKIIKNLKNQNKKLDKIEKKLKKGSSKKTTSESDSLEAYCVRCKTKREIKDPKETTMKNGRDAVKGTCSVCNCNVFRIGKMKK